MKTYLVPACLLAMTVPLCAAPNPPAPASPGLNPHVKALLEACAAYYAGLQSFEVDVTSNTHVDTPTMQNDMGASFHIALERPNSFALQMKAGMTGGTMISDGKTWVTYQPIFNKYTTQNAPELDQLLQPMNMILVEGGLTLGLESFLTKEGLTQLEAGLEESEDVGQEVISGFPAQHLKLISKGSTTELWIENGPKPLLLQSSITPDINASLKNVSAAQKLKLPAGMASMKMVRSNLFINWQTNEPIAATTFQFQPPLGAKLVDEFFPRPPSPLVGKMAPEFQLNDLDGHPVKLADLRGKVVVLDFWATWCGPCMSSLPLVTGVASSLKDKGVVFYGVNLKEKPAQIRQVQSSKNLVFPVLLDEEGKVADLYLAKAIPETVVIDQTGKIAAVHVGYDAAIKPKLTKQLTDLLNGQPASPPATPGPNSTH